MSSSDSPVYSTYDKVGREHQSIQQTCCPYAPSVLNPLHPFLPFRTHEISPLPFYRSSACVAFTLEALTQLCVAQNVDECTSGKCCLYTPLARGSCTPFASCTFESCDAKTLSPAIVVLLQNAFTLIQTTTPNKENKPCPSLSLFSWCFVVLCCVI
jgi:hypothetical protein